MEKIIIDIEDMYFYILEIGKFIDVDFDRMPFKEFTIRANLQNFVSEQTLKIGIQKEIEHKKNLMAKYTHQSDIKLDPFINFQRQNKVNKLKEQLEKEISQNSLLYIDVSFSKENTLVIETNEFKLTVENLHGILSRDERGDFYCSVRKEIDGDIYDAKRRGELSYIQEEGLFDYMASSTVATLGVIGFFQMQQEHIEKDTFKEIKKASEKNKKKNKNKNKRITYVHKSVYHLSEKVKELQKELNDENPNINFKAKGRKYHISEWYQRGHWRKYKNGKIIWIKGCFKHPKNMKQKNEDDYEKIYKIKDK